MHFRTYVPCDKVSDSTGVETIEEAREYAWAPAAVTDSVLTEQEVIEMYPIPAGRECSRKTACG